MKTFESIFPENTLIQKGLWILFIVLSILVGIYPVIYFLIDREFGLLGLKSKELLSNVIWNIGFYIHIISAGLALLIGWTQFSLRIRKSNISLHKQIGKIYLIAVILGSLTGIYIGLFATGGLISSLGFISLGMIWFSTTVVAYIRIKNGRIEKHRKLMTYSYAACFAAVTLRIWLPVLISVFGNFTTAYTIVAWLSWIPNLLAAYFINRRVKQFKV